MQPLNWFGIVLIVLWIVLAVLSILMVNEPREPTSPGAAAMTCLITGLLIFCLLNFGTHHSEVEMPCSYGQVYVVDTGLCVAGTDHEAHDGH